MPLIVTVTCASFLCFELLLNNACFVLHATITAIVLMVSNRLPNMDPRRKRQISAKITGGAASEKRIEVPQLTCELGSSLQEDFERSGIIYPESWNLR
jgi:hypothetical protein